MQTPTHRPQRLQIVVVPAGLNPQGELSKPYRAVVDVALAMHREKLKRASIILAQGNNFVADEEPEHEVARQYLLEQRVAADKIVCPSAEGLAEREAAKQQERNGIVNKVAARAQALLGKHHGKYISTRGNAMGIFEELNDDPALIFAYAPQAARVDVAFRQEGINVYDVIPVQCQLPITKQDIHPDLWYYRSPLVHKAYETALTAATRAQLI